VYKIIAVKELFEYPELYMKNFGYNVFSEAASKGRRIKGGGDDRDAAFASVSVNTARRAARKTPPVFIEARITGKYKHFSDGDVVGIELEQSLKTKGSFTKKGNEIKGRGWIIEDRVYVDVGFGHDVLLYDKNQEKGIALSALKKGEPVLLKNNIADDETQW
jgi:hypothetical protein